MLSSFFKKSAGATKPAPEPVAKPAPKAASPAAPAPRDAMSGPVARAAEFTPKAPGAHIPAPGTTLPNQTGADRDVDQAPETATHSPPETGTSAAGLSWGGAPGSQASPSEAMDRGPSDKLPMTRARVMMAREHIKLGEIDEAVAFLERAEREGPAYRDVYRLLGESYFMQERWRDSLEYWYRTSSMTKRGDERMISQIRRKVMRCNAQLALEELNRGDRVAAAEHMAQAIEAVDYSIYLKVRRDMVDPIVAYARDVLESRGLKPRAVPDKPRHIVICLDVIKISAVHSHKHLYLSLAAALATLDPAIRITLVATYERQISWNAGFEDYYRPDNIEVLRAFMDEKLPEKLRARIDVRYFESFGLRGVINTCEAIYKMAPDMVMYGGGRTGYHANESLVVRHVLHKYLPTGFFFVQSNNDVDELCDVIIARGGHPLNGDPGEALVRHSAYPPFPGLQAAVVPDSMAKMDSDRKRVVTAWVGVRLDKTLHGYENGEVDRILDMIEAVPEADWHLIGAEMPKDLLRDNARFVRLRKAGRVVVHPVLNYDEFYHMAASAALFFQPPGFTGGGGGASIARNNDVPIICFEHSDVAPLQPRDFVFAEDNLQAGLVTAQTVLSSPRERDTLVRKQWRLLEARRSEAPEKFYGAMADGVARYKARRTEARKAAQGAAKTPGQSSGQASGHTSGQTSDKPNGQAGAQPASDTTTP